MIGKETIESIKQGVDLVALIQSRGISLKKNGRGYVGLCPFHEDKKPSLSVNVQTNLWQCFGCGAGGDVIRFVELFDKVAFPQAVKSLEAASPNLKADHEVKPIHRDSLLTTKELKLLERVVSYYQHTFTQDQRGLNYLKNERSITDPQSLKDFGAGYVNGTLLEILPQDEEVINVLKKIGLLNAKGHELFYNSVVFPLYNQNGSVVNLYGRSIDDGHEVHHLYLPGPRQGIINRQAVKRSQTILLTESIIDALTLYAQGFKNTIPIYGVNGLLEEHLSLLNRRIKEAYLVFDADEAGRKGAEAVFLRLGPRRPLGY
jgi:DNA primase